MVADTNVVRKPTDAKGVTSIFDVKVVKVKTVATVKGPVCDSPFVNGAKSRPHVGGGSSPGADPGFRADGWRWLTGFDL